MNHWDMLFVFALTGMTICTIGIGWSFYMLGYSRGYEEGYFKGRGDDL